MTMQELRELNAEMDALEVRIAELESTYTGSELEDMTLDGYRRRLKELGETVVN